MLGYLSEVLGADYVETQIQNYGTVELSPLESIRGRSFDNAIVISDESSNMTVGEIEKWVTDKIVRGKSIHIQPKTHNQDLFLQSMRDNIITIVGVLMMWLRVV